MKLVALTLLRSCPIHEETEVVMDHRYGHDHIAKDSECRDSGQEPENEAQPAKEFCSNRQKCEQRRNVQGAGEESHHAGEAYPPNQPSMNQWVFPLPNPAKPNINKTAGTTPNFSINRCGSMLNFISSFLRCNR
jgi:hypothetical protein